VRSCAVHVSCVSAFADSGFCDDNVMRVLGDPGGRRADVFRGHNLREGTYSPRVFGGQARARMHSPLRLSWAVAGAACVAHPAAAPLTPPLLRARARARAAHRPGARGRHAHRAGDAARAQARARSALFFFREAPLWR
jgi:hypothetical protein